MRKILIIIVFFFLFKGLLVSQNNIFQQDWESLSAEIPASEEKNREYIEPGVIISVDFRDTLSKISPYLTGYNQPVHARGAFNEEPQAVRHVRNVKAEVLRYPGGTAAMSFFWDRTKTDGPPPDVDTYIRSDEVQNSFRYGMTGGDFFSLDRYYSLIDSVETLNSIIVVNYGYARYGRSDNPVQKAAHYAAEWVRYDNGRTKFWEIGNEISGRWTPGHRIDTLKNKDGQPEFINGTLYARHFKIFADSMRAAASETGSEIKIGGVLSHTEGSWNREFLENASGIADFLIIHEYYGSEGTNDPVYAVKSADALISHKEKADADINAYSEKELPVVLTEWNTKDAGQADVCIYGISGMRAIKNIIEADYGLSCRHTLLQNNERGLINNAEEYNPDIGIWQPRASYFYFYYLGKTMGDHYHPSTVTGNENIEAIVSSFSSGEKAMIVINYSDKGETVALNLENFSTAPRYYIYRLTPEENDPFSPKVKVNGQTNNYYKKGGPFEYEGVKAFSYETSGLVDFKLPAYSAVYLIMQGEDSQNDNLFEIEFNIYGKIRDSVFTMPGTFISVNSSSAFTNEKGMAVFNTESGSGTYYAQKNSFKKIEKEILISSDTLITDTLDIDEFDVKIELTDGPTGTAIEGIRIALDEYSGFSSIDGSCLFENIAGGELDLIIDTPDFYYIQKLNILSDTIIRLSLNRRLYKLEIILRDSVNKSLLMGVNITIGDVQYSTDLYGSLILEIERGEYKLLIQDENYRSKLVTMELQKDSSFIIYLEPLFAELKFRISENSIPLNDVKVMVNEQEKLSNSLGICTFSGLGTGQIYSFSLRKKGFLDIDSTVFLVADTVIELNMIPSTNSEDFTVNGLKIYPNPATEEVFIRSDQFIRELRVLDLAGKVIKEVTPVKTKEINLDTHKLKEGIYILDLRIQEYRLKKFLIIQK